MMIRATTEIERFGTCNMDKRTSFFMYDTQDYAGMLLRGGFRRVPHPP
jgi:hypothetical protein